MVDIARSLAILGLAAIPLSTPRSHAHADTDSLDAPPNDIRDDPTRDIRSFRPSRHGFAFVNRFEGAPLPLGPCGHLLPTSTAHGLCGGMVRAAVDDFLTATPISDARSPPGRNSPLRRRLLRRQTQSFGWLGWQAMRFAHWMTLPPDGPRGANARIARELDRLRHRLDAGRPAPIGLVYSPLRETVAIWRNHQVLAYGLSEAPDGSVEIAIYDPNLPRRDDVRLRLRPIAHASTDPSRHDPPPAYRAEQIVPGGTTRALHGVFLMPYAGPSD